MVSKYLPQVLFHIHAPVGQKRNTLIFQQGALFGPSRCGFSDAVYDPMAGKRAIGWCQSHRSSYPSCVLWSSGQYGYFAIGEYFTQRDLPGNLVHFVEKFS